MPHRLATAVPAVVFSLVIGLSLVVQTGESGVIAPDGPAIAPWIDTGDRQAVEEAFAGWHVDGQHEVNWTGSYEGCAAGDSSDELRAATIDRVNYFRAMAGVPAVVTEDEGFSQLAQAGALMMSAEGRLSHHPESDYACFSADGERAAANSNLYLGRVGPWAVDGYIEDPGDKNIDVGHRITILHPPTTRMGVGHVAGDESRYPANVLWVFDEDVFEDDTETREDDGFVAWPPRGFVPGELVYPRWSFTLSEADFDDAELTMTANGESIPLQIVARLSKDGEVPSSVLVWEPSLTVMEASEDVTYTITIEGVGIERPPVSLALSDTETTGETDADAELDSVTFTYEVTVLARGDGGLGSTVMAALEPASDRARSVVDAGRKRLRFLGL